MSYPWHTTNNGQFVVSHVLAHGELAVYGWPNGHFAVCLVPGTRQSDQTNPIFCFSRMKDPISQHIYHRHYISHIYHNKYHRHYISQLATNNIKTHIQKSIKFANTYPKDHKSINAEINKFIAEVGHRTEVGRRGEVATTRSAGTSVRWAATFLAYSMPPIDSATKESRLHVRCKSSSQLIM